MIDLATDPRASAWWKLQAPMVSAMQELLDTSPTDDLADTQYASIKMINYENKRAARRHIQTRHKLALSIRDNGLIPGMEPIVKFRQAPPFVTVRGLHRAWILKALGRPVMVRVVGEDELAEGDDLSSAQCML